MRELCPWYALTVKHQHEVLARSALEFKGFEVFVPTYRARRRWSDRVKEIDLPLFAGYVFCRFAFTERIKVMDAPGVAKVVEFGGQPAEISEGEIVAIRTVMASRLPVRPWPYLKPGDRLRVERGPLRGVEGTLLREERGRLQLVIGIEMLQRSLAVEVEADMVTPVRARWCGLNADQNLMDDRPRLAAGGCGRFRASYVNDIERKTAEELAQGKIVARAKGPMEFEARALRNRSILARADSLATVRTIMRDVDEYLALQAEMKGEICDPVP